MAIDKSAELAKAAPKKDPNQLSPMQRLLLQLADEYTPAVDAHWANPNPTSVGEALDRLAAEIIAQTAATEIS
jgi:hypothetical protein